MPIFFYDLYKKSIVKSKSFEDGLRVSVMSRHTLEDGTTPDERITSDSFDVWVRDLAPPLKLVGGYHRGEVNWKDFEARYLEHIRQDAISIMTQALSRYSLENNLTLLCIEDFADFCHRRLLAEELQRFNSRLKIEHK